MEVKRTPEFREWMDGLRGDVLIILLIGGDKSTQQKDIRKAQALAANL